MSDKGRHSPTKPPAEALSPALARNIDALVQRRRREARTASLEERAADRISRFAGSMPFVYLHAVAFGAWIIVNLGLIPGIRAWDPSLVVLAMVASVEAIFLSTFVLINQNRMAEEDNARADLDLQISLLNEHETTRLITMVAAIAKRMDVETAADDELEELQRDVAPEAVLDSLDEKNSR